MVKKYIVWLVTLILLVIVIWQNQIISKQKDEIRKQAQDITASFQYIKELTNQIKGKEEQRQTDEELKSVLRDYLAEQKQNEELNKPTVTAEDLQVELQRYRRKNNRIPDRLPLEGEFAISQSFSKKHPACDFAAPIGTPVKAAGSGVVVQIYEDKYFGITVEIDHLNGYITRYAHLAKILTTPKMFVEKGENIALVGNTGNSTAPHLHFEIRREGRAVNPDSLLIR
ncbi:MAG: M23 family metallopeptidase [Candidatus Cloacimonadota bacterium]|nr:M23 family metallopeptidase [Candidatus Cloacimonadota bacterium]